MSELFLCLDTSTSTARVAILDAEAGVRFSGEFTADRHAAHLLPLCAEALRAAGVTPAALAGIACGGGPGSFTGLRVGLAAAKGLALPTGVSLYVVSSLEALALDILNAGDAAPGSAAIPSLDAGKGEVYVAGYVADVEHRVRELAPVARLAPAAVPAWLKQLPSLTVQAAGNGAVRYPTAFAAARIADVAGPTAVSVGTLALLQRARGEAADLATAVPFYGRPPDITVKRSP
ncbi:MAG TPA: tRNA (adenosine(37)-N6)-threonylcarbamoyltransferase complex dimerization subunit type 1 TsaB [Polyangia bacterium]|jgi:tRNA threonylcarbamoyladenosine biosynthesis protein TsaB